MARGKDLIMICLPKVLGLELDMILVAFNYNHGHSHSMKVVATGIPVNTRLGRHDRNMWVGEVMNEG